MKIPAFFAIAGAMSASAFAQTSAPAAPTLTAGAEFKGLRLDWDTVPGASWYQLEYRAHQTGSFVKQGSDYPATATSARFTFPLHLYDWTYARYRLAACNSAGCSRSAEVSVSNLRRDAVGYFKAAQPAYGAALGDDVDLSSDGYNFVASAPYESDPTPDDDYVDGGAAYVFRRGADGKWFQRARIDVDGHSYYLDETKLSVATSGSGNTIAVGLGSKENVEGLGEVYVYHAPNGSGTYSRTRIPRPAGVEVFGTNVALSDSGYVLAIGAGDLETRGVIYKSVNGVWQRVRDLPTEGPVFCYEPLLSRDGKTIAQQCSQWKTATTPRRELIRVHSGSNWSVRTDIDLEISDTDELEWGHRAFAIDGTGDTIAVQFSNYEVGTSNGTAFVKVYKRGAAGYSEVATLTPGAWRTIEYGYEYGAHLSLSGDGHTLAVGDAYDNGTNWGPRAAPLLSGTAQYGAVDIYRLTDSWKIANVVKPNYIPMSWMEGYWGRRIALSQTGKTLIVGFGGESSSAKGIDGNWANSDLEFAGAVFMY